MEIKKPLLIILYKMNLLRFQSVFALSVILLIFRYDQANSTTPAIMMDDNGYCEFSDAEEDMCSSYCYKSVKPPLAYIIELKEQMKAKAQEHLEKDNENREIRQRLLDLSDYRDHIKALNQHIEELRKMNEILGESAQRQNHISETDQLKAKDLQECLSIQDSLKKELELERKSRIELEKKSNLDTANLINEKFSKLSKELKAIEESLSNDIKECKSQVSTCKKQLEESQTEKREKDIVEGNENVPKTSCKGLSSGIYTIAIPEFDPFTALCNGDIDGGGWIVIQKRFDGSEDFYRNWTEYRKGFGKLDGEFFIGLEALHRITNSQSYELYIQMGHFNGKFSFASYNNFRIGNENENYELLSLGEFKGSTVDRLKWSLFAEFSTFDHDNDHREDLNWAEKYHSGWWYKYYLRTNLNGRYYKDTVLATDSMHWFTNESLKSVQMLIRQKFP